MSDHVSSQSVTLDDIDLTDLDVFVERFPHD